MPEIVKCDSSDSVNSTLSIEFLPKPTPVIASISSSENENDEKEEESNESGGSEVFQVEQITGMKFMKNQRHFKIRWQGYGTDADTWEPESHLRENLNLVQLIDEYIEEHGDVKPKVIKRRAKVENKPRYEEESVSEEEEWFGIKPDECNREKRNLYVADRIPSFTEKILSEIDPGVRVLRNHLRSSLGGNPSDVRSERSRSRVKSETPSSISSSMQSTQNNGGTVGGGRRGRPKTAKKWRDDDDDSRDASLDDGRDDLPMHTVHTLDDNDRTNVEPELNDRELIVIASACDQDGTKVVRKRFISRPKLAESLNDIFTCDDNGVSGQSTDNSTPDGKLTAEGEKQKRRRVDDASPTAMKAKRKSDPSSSSAALKKTSHVERKPAKETTERRRSSTSSGSGPARKSEQSHKRKANGDKMDEMQKKIKQSGAVGIKNLACRRSAMASERFHKAAQAIPADVPDDQLTFVEQLVAGKLLPEQKKPEDRTLVADSTAAAKSAADSKPTTSGKAPYTSATSSSLYKPRPYKISRMTGCPPTSTPRQPAVGGTGVDAKPTAAMHKVSKTLSSGTIIDSLIPVSKASSSSSSSLSVHSGGHLMTSGMTTSGMAGGSAPPLPSPAVLGHTDNNPMTVRRETPAAAMLVESRQRVSPPQPQPTTQSTLSIKTPLPMECRPLTKSFETLISERMASVRLLTLTLSQTDFEESAVDGNVQRVRAALSVEDNTLDLNAVALEGGTLLHRISERKCDSNHAYCDIIELLVRNGARMDMREPRDRGSPLHTAVAAGRLCHVRKLLALRSPVNLTDNAERTPLIVALERGRDDEYVSALLTAGATFHVALRHKSLDRPIIHAHQKQLQATFDQAIGTIFSNVKCKPMSPIFVNTLYDSRQVEHSFSVRDLVPPGPNQAYAVLTCMCTITGDKVEGRMCGYTPVQHVYVNNRPCVPLTKFVQLAAPRNGLNTLTVELDSGLMLALANTGRLSIGRRGGAGDRPSDFVCAGLRMLTQVYYLHFNRHYNSSGGGVGHLPIGPKM